MKATNLQLTDENSGEFTQFHSDYRGYVMAKKSLEAAEDDMKTSRNRWIELTPEFDEAQGEAGVSIISEEGEMIASFTKARAVNTLDTRGYIDAVLEAAGVNKMQRTTVTGLLVSTGLMDEISISARLAKKVHTEAWEDTVTTEAKGARTVKFL